MIEASQREVDAAIAQLETDADNETPRYIQ